MKNIKATLHSVITLAIISISCSGSEHMGERAAKILSKGLADSTQLGSVAAIEGAQKFGIDAARVASDSGIEATKIAAAAAIETSQKIGVDAAMTIGEAGKDISKNLSTGLENGATKIGSDATKNLVNGFAPVAKAYIAYKVVADVTTIGVDLYKYNNPDDEKKARIRQAQETIAVIDTKRAFRSCLMSNAKGPRNKANLPAACEDCGSTFAMTAGPAEFDNMILAFKKAYQD